MLPGYMDCARRAAASHWRDDIVAAGYKLRETKKSIGGCVGTAVHSAASEMLESKKASGILPPTDDLADVGMESFHSEISDGVEWDDKTRASNVAEKQVFRMIASYRDWVNTKVNPLLIEEAMESNIADSAIMTGRIDVFTVDGMLADLKCGKIQRQHHSQVGAYSLLLKAAGWDCNAVAVDWIPRESITKPQPPPVRQIYDQDEAEMAAWSVASKVVADYAEWEKDKDNVWAFHANPMSQMCGERYCKAHGTDWCKLGKI